MVISRRTLLFIFQKETFWLAWFWLCSLLIAKKVKTYKILDLLKKIANGMAPRQSAKHHSA
jgi:hypothetical protein